MGVVSSRKYFLSSDLHRQIQRYRSAQDYAIDVYATNFSGPAFFWGLKESSSYMKLLTTRNPQLTTWLVTIIGRP